MSAVICSTCGSELPSGEDTCPRCGTRVPPQPSVPAAPSPPPPTAPSSASTAPSPAPPSASVTAGPAAHPPDSGTSPVPVTPTSVTQASLPTFTPEEDVTQLRSAASLIPPPHPRPAAPDPQPSATPPKLTPYVEDQVQSLLRNGHISLRRGNLRAARDLCEQALALYEPDPNAHELIGLIMEAEGDEIGAYREYRKACEGEYKPTEAETRLAKLALRMPPETLAMLQPQKKAAIENELPPEAADRLAKEARSVLASIEFSAALKPRRRASESFASLLIPGCGQFIKGQPAKAMTMFMVWLVSIAWILKMSSTSTKLNPAYNDYTVWAAAAVILLDYIVSILDARSES